MVFTHHLVREHDMFIKMFICDDCGLYCWRPDRLKHAECPCHRKLNNTITNRLAVFLNLQCNHLKGTHSDFHWVIYWSGIVEDRVNVKCRPKSTGQQIYFGIDRSKILAQRLIRKG